MKNFLAIATLLISGCAFASSTMTVSKSSFPSVSWSSKDSTDVTTINNGSDAPIAIFIQVQGKDTSGNLNDGINIKNCGKISHVNAGSSVVCVNSDANNPVSFSADGTPENRYAYGIYQVKQQ